MYGVKVLLSSSSSSFSSDDNDDDDDDNDDDDDRKEATHGRLFLAKVLFVFLCDTGFSVQMRQSLKNSSLLSSQGKAAPAAFNWENSYQGKETRHMDSELVMPFTEKLG